MVPSLGLDVRYDSRRGRVIKLPPLSGSARIQTIKDGTINIAGAKLFNSLPKILCDFNGLCELFKKLLDEYLEIVPDRPVIGGYHTCNLDIKGNQSNCLSEWSRNLQVHGVTGIGSAPLHTQTEVILPQSPLFVSISVY